MDVHVWAGAGLAGKLFLSDVGGAQSGNGRGAALQPDGSSGARCCARDAAHSKNVHSCLHKGKAPQPERHHPAMTSCFCPSLTIRRSSGNHLQLHKLHLFCLHRDHWLKSGLRNSGGDPLLRRRRLWGVSMLWGCWNVEQLQAAAAGLTVTPEHARLWNVETESCC